MSDNGNGNGGDITVVPEDWNSVAQILSQTVQLVKIHSTEIAELRKMVRSMEASKISMGISILMMMLNGILLWWLNNALSSLKGGVLK